MFSYFMARKYSSDKISSRDLFLCKTKTLKRVI